MGITDWRVYQFGNGAAEGDANMSDLLGGKGANLAEMSRLGLPVPPGFTLPTDVCHYFIQNDGRLPDTLRATVIAALKEMGAPLGATFGDVDAPLLVSVRSGSRASMPGMMDTVLNIGLNDKLLPRSPPMPEMPVLHGTAIAALFRCMAMWLWACRKIFSRKYWTITSWSKH